MLWKSLLQGSCHTCSVCPWLGRASCRSWGSAEPSPSSLPFSGKRCGPSLLTCPFLSRSVHPLGDGKARTSLRHPGLPSLPACSALGGGGGTWSCSGPLHKAGGHRSPACIPPVPWHGTGQRARTADTPLYPPSTLRAAPAPRGGQGGPGVAGVVLQPCRAPGSAAPFSLVTRLAVPGD